MNLKRLLNIRPKPGASIAELREAIGAAEAARAEAIARVESLMAQRGALLLDGAAEEVSRHEIAVTAARDDAARAGALHDALVARLAQAERDERRAAFTSKLAEAESANAAWRAFVNNAYPSIARKLAAGLALEAAAIRSAKATFFAYYNVPEDEREGLQPSQGPDLLPNPPDKISGGWHLGANILLPSIDRTAPYWSPEDGQS